MGGFWEHGSQGRCFPAADLPPSAQIPRARPLLQFGRYFAAQALDPSNAQHVERDDFALEKANMDE